MNIHIRQKQLKNGQSRVYLEYYWGAYKDQNGKTKTKRTTEFLDLHTYTNPTTKQQRQANKEALNIAEQIKTKRELEAITDAEGLPSATKLSKNLLEFLDSHARQPNGQLKSGFAGFLRQFQAFAGDNITFKEATPQFCREFKTYLETEARTASGKALEVNTKVNYVTKLKGALKAAKKQGLIKTNPAEELEPGTEQDTEVIWLNTEELKALHATPCNDETLKAAFLFSAACGLRFSDIQQITWGQLHRNNEGTLFLHFRQQKTKGLQYHPLSANAEALLPDSEGAEGDKIFPGLKYSTRTNDKLNTWAKAAGLTKPLTFHVGRHTFAVSFLNNGGDIYTLSKLLGHKSLRATLRYASISDAKKEQSIANFPSFL